MPHEPNVGKAKAQLLDDFSQVVTDTEALLRAVASVPGDKASALRASVEESLGTAKKHLRELQGAAVEKTAAAARATDEYVHDNPWPLIASAAAVGVLVGLMVRGERE
jgi:ElaB/YqjD/DUF883 family membrane-anchored ribosome-binding protein